jgi:hypothetical protein
MKRKLKNLFLHEATPCTRRSTRKRPVQAKARRVKQKAVCWSFFFYAWREAGFSLWLRGFV